ncbi:MAG: leucine-rich repeat protein [Ruminococcus sp.]|nr:leucine-rich repeat protein [Ruminococcus sp.]
MNKKRLFAGVLSLAMAFSTLPTLGAVSAVSFAAESAAAQTGAATGEEDNTVVIDSLTYRVFADRAEFIKCEDTASGDVVIADEVSGVPVTRISGRAFAFCDSITSVKIPAKVTSIGDHLAGYAMALEKYTVDEKNETFCAVDGVVYTKDMKKLVAYPTAYPSTDFTVPSSVEVIGDGAAYTANIVNLIIPDSVTEVEGFAFTYCKSLKTVKLSAALKKIGYSGFGNTALESVELPSATEEIGPSAFNGCRALKTITVNNPDMKIGSSAIETNEELVIRGGENSTAQAYAAENGVTFENVGNIPAGTAVVSGTSATTTAATTTGAETVTTSTSQLAETVDLKFGTPTPIVKIIDKKPYEVKVAGNYSVSGEKVLDQTADSEKIEEIKKDVIVSVSQAVQNNKNITPENYNAYYYEIRQEAIEYFNNNYAASTGYTLTAISIATLVIKEQEASTSTGTASTTAAETTTTAATTASAATTSAETAGTSTTTVASTTASATSTEPVTTEVSAKNFVGTWKVSGLRDKDGQYSDITNNDSFIMIFNEGGTGTATFNGGKKVYDINWKIKDNLIAVTNQDESDTSIIDLNIENADLLSYFDEEDSESTYFSKDSSKLGDVNEDASINAKDASFVLVAYAKASTGSDDGLSDTQRAAADVNADGKVDAKDASAILAFYSYLSTGGKDSFETFLKK